jgi:thioredoxin reductase
MERDNNYDVIIIGGSYAGLQAAMTLGRALRRVLVIDSGKPCNRQTPKSHNFLTQDGETPSSIIQKAQEQLTVYNTVSIVNDTVTETINVDNVFRISTIFGLQFTSRKVLFATGIKDIMPAIEGFAACWGISVIHCPYCHGYEVHHQYTGVLANGDTAYEYAKLINNWTHKLTVFTNGPSTLNSQQEQMLRAKNIEVVDARIQEIGHNKGQMKYLMFNDGSQQPLSALYARVPFEQHSRLPVYMGCEVTDNGLLKVDSLGKTNIYGLYAAGDNASLMRSVAGAVAAGMAAGAAINKELIEDDF